MRCRKCSAVRIIERGELEGTTVAQSLKDWVTGHLHDFAQDQKELDLKNQIKAIAANAVGQKNTLENLEATKQKLLGMVGGKVDGKQDGVRVVPETKGRKFR